MKTVHPPSGRRLIEWLTRPWVLLLALGILLAVGGWYAASYLEYGLQGRIVAALIPPLAIIAAALLFIVLRWSLRRFRSRRGDSAGPDATAVSRLVDALHEMLAQGDSRPWLVLSHGSQPFPERAAPTEARPVSSAGAGLAVYDAGDAILITVPAGVEAAGQLEALAASVPNGPWKKLVFVLRDDEWGAATPEELGQSSRGVQSAMEQGLGRRLPVWLMAAPARAFGTGMRTVFGDAGRGARISQHYARGRGEDLAEFSTALNSLSAFCHARLPQALADKGDEGVVALLDEDRRVAAASAYLSNLADHACRPSAGHPAGPLAGGWIAVGGEVDDLIRSARALAAEKGAAQALRASGGSRFVSFMRYAAVAACVAVLAGFSLHIHNSLEERRSALSDTLTALDDHRAELARASIDVERRVRAARRVLSAHQALSRAESSSPLAPGGIHRDALDDTLERAVFHALDVAVRAPTYALLERELDLHAERWAQAGEDGLPAERQYYYGVLAAYLMLTEHTDRLDVNRAAPILVRLWIDHELVDNSGETRIDASSPVQQLAHYHLSHLEEQYGRLLYRHRADENRVARARQDLQIEVDVETLYAGVRAELEAGMPRLDLPGVTGTEHALAFAVNAPLSALWTRDAWLETVGPRLETAAREAIHGDWVLGTAGDEDGTPDPEAESALLDALWTHYEADYARAWQRYLAGLRLNGNDLASQAESVALLASNDGGLSAVVEGLAKHLMAPGRGSLPSDIARRIRSAVGLDQDLPPALGGLGERLPNTYRLLTAVEHSPDAVSAFQSKLGALADELEELAGDSDLPRAADAYARAILSGDGNTLADLAEELEGLATAIRLVGGAEPGRMSPFDLAVDTSWNTVLGAARQHVRTAWRQDVHSAYRREVAGRYPMSRAQVDVSPEALGRLIAPGSGSLWQFTEQALGDYGRISGGNWREQSWRGRGLGLSRSMTRSLRQAHELGDRLFPRGNIEPRIPLQVYPIPVSGVAEIRLRSGDQEFRYRNEPQRWHGFDWPGDGAGGQLRVVPRGGGRGEDLQADGQWALFRLLEQANIEVLGTGEFEARWQFDLAHGPSTVRLRFRTDNGAHTLFTGRSLTRFSLPESPF